MDHQAKLNEMTHCTYVVQNSSSEFERLNARTRLNYLLADFKRQGIKVEWIPGGMTIQKSRWKIITP